MSTTMIPKINISEEEQREIEKRANRALEDMVLRLMKVGSNVVN